MGEHNVLDILKALIIQMNEDKGCRYSEPVDIKVNQFSATGSYELILQQADKYVTLRLRPTLIEGMTILHG